jgi:hypothetical protein
MKDFIAKITRHSSGEVLTPIIVKSESIEKAKILIKGTHYFDEKDKIEIKEVNSGTIDLYWKNIQECIVYQPDNTLWDKIG